MPRLALAALFLAAAPALAQTPAASDTPPAPEDTLLRFHYTCDGGQGFDAVFVNTAAGNGYAIVGLDGALIPMEVAISASGARYLSIAEDGPRYQFWTKGMDATLSTLEGEAETPLMADCTGE